MMRLAIISPFQLRLGRGIERYNWEMARTLAARGLEVELWVWDAPRPFDWGALPPGVRLRRVPYIRYFMATWAGLWYRRWCRTQPDHILLAFADYGEAAALRTYAGAFSIMFHFPREQVPHRFATLGQSGLAARAHALLSPTQYVAQDVQAAYGRPSPVIMHGVNLAQFVPDPSDRLRLRAELGVSADAPVIVSVAALELRKGIQFVVRALPAVVQQFPTVQYWVVGEGSDRPQIEAEIAAHGMGAHVRLFGRVTTVPRYLNAADVGALLSWGEALPIGALEMLAMRLPVVTSDRPPFPALIHPDYGALVDGDNTDTLAALLTAWLRDPARRAAMGDAGRAYIERELTWERAADAFIKVLTAPSDRGKAG
jgi:glycosyltransferase involved in cell wall biosynthesis